MSATMDDLDLDLGVIFKRDELSVAIRLWMAQNGGAAHWKLFNVLRTTAEREFANPLKAEEVAVRRMWIAVWLAEGVSLEIAAEKAGTSQTTAKADKRALEEIYRQRREAEEPWRPDADEAARPGDPIVDVDGDDQPA